MKQIIRLAPVLIVVLQFFSASLAIAEADSATQATRAFGESARVGNGMAWAWVEYDAKKAPVAIGFTLTETAISGLPPEPPSPDVDTWEFPLALPAGFGVPPYTHLVLNWNPHGHIPPGVYDVSHFDFHFYVIDQGQRKGITCKGADKAKCTKKLPSEFIPAGYILPEGTEMPRMGAHWIDPSSPEFNKQAFTQTFIYGSYNGRLAFVEPMVTNTYLETKSNVTGTLKLPAKYQKHGYYPTTYSIKYDPMRKEYSVSLDGLVKK